MNTKGLECKGVGVGLGAKAKMDPAGKGWFLGICLLVARFMGTAI